MRLAVNAHRFGLAIFMLIAGLALPVRSSDSGSVDPLELSQAAIGNRVSDLELIDTQGNTHRLHELLHRPLGISLVYTACAHSCSVTTRALNRVIQVARDSLGQDEFGMLTIGFDRANDTPRAMAAYARRHGVDDANWLFTVAGDAGSLQQLVDELGFVYEPSPRGFDHTVQVSLVDEKGRVYRQVYGETFEPPLLVEPLKDLVLGRPEPDEGLLRSIGKRIRLFCTVYDARSGRYRFDYSMFIGMILGGLFLAFIAGWMIAQISSRRRRQT